MPAMNPYSMMRMKQVLGLEDNPEGKDLGPAWNSQPQTMEQPAAPPRPVSRFEQMLTEEGPSAGAYRQHLNTMPQEADNKPSTGRRIAAALLGLGAGFTGNEALTDVAMGHINAPFRKKMSDWKNKAGALKDAADIEQVGTRNRMMGRKMDIDESDKHADNERQLQKLEVDRQNANTAEERAAIDAEIRRRQVSRQEARDVWEKDVAYGGLDVRRESNAIGRERNAVSREGLDIRRKGTAPKPATPGAQDKADQLAMIEIAREKPEFASLLDEKGNLLPPEKGGWFSKGTDMDLYNRFLTEIAVRRGKILHTGTDAYGGVGDDE